MNNKQIPLTALTGTMLAVCALVSVLSARAQNSTIYWVNPGGGNWYDTNNWSPRQVPASSNAVFVTLPGTYTVTVAPGPGIYDAVAASLTLGGPSGVQTLALGTSGYLAVTGAVSTAANTLIALDNGATFNAQGGGLIAGTVEWTSGWFWGPFTITPSGVVNLRGPGPMHLRRELVNHGVINWFDGAWDFTECLLDNQPDGLLNFTNGGTLGFNWLFAIIKNAGTLRKSGGTNNIIVPNSFQFTNTGLVSVQSGALQFDVGFTSSGIFDVATNAALWLKYGNYNFLTGHHCQGEGYYGVPGPTSVALQGVIPDPNFQLDGAINGTVSVTGTLQWNSGDIYGAVTVASNGTLNARGPGYKRLPGGTVANHGVVNWSEGGWEIWNSTIINHADGRFVVAQDGGFSRAGGANLFQNFGTFRKSAGTGTFAVSYFPFTNTGVLDVQSGTLSFDGSYSQSGGRSNFGLRSASNYGRISFSGDAPLTGTLSANLVGGYLPAAGSSFAVVSYPSRTGSFGALDLPALLPPDDWQLSYGASAAALSIIKGQPRLQLTQPGADLVFTWPTNALPGYALQRATNLIPTPQWNTLTDTPSVVGDQYLITRPPGDGDSFYRLIK